MFFCVNIYSQFVFCLASSPEGDASCETDRAVGGAMGMLSSLTSVVQSTVSRR